jgi:rRNA maturation RNase YbeY
MAITYLTENVKLPKQFKKRLTSRWIKEVILSCGKKPGSIVFVFCDDGKILEINRQYLQHDYYTDIITFDYTEGDTLSGDIFISLDTVKTNAQAYKTDYEEELRRVIIHGILHLCGYDDKTSAKKKIMRKKENDSLLGYNNND